MMCANHWSSTEWSVLVGKTGLTNGEKQMDCQLGVGKHVHIPDANYWHYILPKCMYHHKGMISMVLNKCETTVSTWAWFQHTPVSKAWCMHPRAKRSHLPPPLIMLPLLQQLHWWACFHGVAQEHVCADFSGWLGSWLSSGPCYCTWSKWWMQVAALANHVWWPMHGPPWPGFWIRCAGRFPQFKGRWWHNQGWRFRRG